MKKSELIRPDRRDPHLRYGQRHRLGGQGTHCQHSGADEYNGGDLHSQTAETHISGMGSATVWVDKELDANISGAGT